MKREWIPGDENIQEKLDGVTEILTRAGWDDMFRKRLMSHNATTRREAFAEGGAFEGLPEDFNVQCWEREGAVAAETDNTVSLVLPKFEELPEGADPRPAPAEELWLCTWNPYKDKQTDSAVAARKPHKKQRPK